MKKNLPVWRNRSMVRLRLWLPYVKRVPKSILWGETGASRDLRHRRTLRRTRRMKDERAVEQRTTGEEIQLVPNVAKGASEEEEFQQGSSTSSIGSPSRGDFRPGNKPKFVNVLEANVVDLLFLHPPVQIQRSFLCWKGRDSRDQRCGVAGGGTDN